MEEDPTNTHKFWTTEEIKKAIAVRPSKWEEKLKDFSDTVDDDKRQDVSYVYKSVGVLLFTLGGKRAYGTAYAAEVPGKEKWKNIIFTAGHNLVEAVTIKGKDGEKGENKLVYAENICFIPAFLNNFKCPYGMFDAVEGGLGKGFVLPESYQPKVLDPVDDIGAVRLKKNSKGKHLGEEVPLLEIVFGQQYSEDTSFQVIGYTKVNEMRESFGSFKQLDAQNVVRCTAWLSEGSSGGPWVLSGLDVNGHTAIGTSYKEDDLEKTELSSPYYSKDLITRVINWIEVAEVM